MKILGIDPGTRVLGYCILELRGEKYELIEAGILKFKKNILKEQILELVDGLDTILEAHHIDEVAIEDIFYAHNPQTVLKLAQFRGALTLKILLNLGDYHEYTPLQVKQAITGNGKANKEQVAFMVKRLLKIKKEIKPLDITDAMAIAITHAQRVKHRKVLRKPSG
ncbi:MAG: Crossover junction endodeoxyribonuclease RuvC (EC [uncultured Sulfurovum sp.]|uniref:Crossover junction endodeoxyribonuclease RuvC n=1 Tax=uncultured Sulfurovum sp. TaxID=269237 RepID=A0A6S6UHW4_9BACT|nr:MAG: Crossover junction endodeoxyribonuclease RuvC (EC [uncultured Sulfurovum sp.]